jgi:pSer/pThr/pTyr-binding forkhead associated (FHA) protein
MSARASIVLVARDGGEGPAHPLGDTTDIGRTEGHVLVTEDAYISPRHARITQRAGGYYLRDLGTTNGIFMRIPALANNAAGGDGRDLSQAAGGVAAAPPTPNLKDQDLFLAGQQVLRFEVVKDAEEGFGVASDNGTLLFGTPASPRYGRLVQRTVEGVTRDVFHLRKTETVLGREGGDIVFTDDPFLSRRHVLLRVNLAPVPPGPGSSGNRPDTKQERSYSLVDLGSSNGTFLKVHDEVRLRNGDQFRIGQQLFRFDLDDLTPRA